MPILNEILSFLTNFNIHIYSFTLALMCRFKLRKGRLWILLLGSALVLFVPYVYRRITDLSFYSSFFFMIGWYSISYLVLCAFLFLIFYLSFQISAKEQLLILCCAYLLQNIVYQFYRVLARSVPTLGHAAGRVLNLLIVLAICAVICVIFKKKMIIFDLNRVKTPSALFFSACLIVLLTVISQWLDQFTEDVAVMRLGIYLYAGIASTFLLCILLLIFNSSRLRYEYAVINELYKKAEKQHRISRENIDYINQKVHDMKHQIAAIKQMIVRGAGGEEIGGRMAELEKTAKVYDDTILTGSSILDTLLTEQKLFCDKNNIQLDCVVDGAALGFLDPVDLYVVFGNAIDNAVESVLKIGDAERRVITVAARQGGGFVSIRFENPYEGQIVLQRGLPHTSKEGEDFHGFGIKSIRFIVRKYGGNMTISAEDGRFSLCLLIPVRANGGKPPQDGSEKDA